MNPERVNYYGPNDLAWYHNLEQAESVLSEFKEDKNYDINDLLEFYQIKLYIDNEMYLTKWNSDDIQKVKGKIDSFWKLIVTFWKNINSDNISKILKQLECWTFQESFWDITTKISGYKNISKESFLKLLQLEQIHISDILHHNKLVKYYSFEIRNYLLRYDKSAELLLSQYVEKHDRERRGYYFPKCLSLKDREQVILSYIDYKDANLNYIRLILNIRKHSELEISDKTKLKAQKKEEELNNKLFENSNGMNIETRLIFCEDQEKTVIASGEGDTTTIFSYSKKYINKTDHPYRYLLHFIGLFEYMNHQKCISMVSKYSDLGVMERTFMSSKNEYPIGSVFHYQENLSFLQIFSYDQAILKPLNKSVEYLIQNFIEKSLNKLFDLKGFRFTLPSASANHLEKIITLLAQFDSLLKQYKLFQEDGEVNFDLLRISSKPLHFNEIPSFVSRKYCYLKDGKLGYMNHLLFSDQSSLFYVDPFKNKYHSLYDLLANEEILYGNFAEYQMVKLYHLFEQKFLFVDHKGYLKIKDKNQLFVLNQLYREEVVSYWHYPEECRSIVDDMEKEGLVYFENTLLNKLERNYFNYYLNKKEFTNGLDLRNSFMHGTNTMSENEQKNLYYILLRIIILTLLKINDDQRLKFKLENSQPKTEKISTK